MCVAPLRVPVTHSQINHAGCSSNGCIYRLMLISRHTCCGYVSRVCDVLLGCKFMPGQTMGALIYRSWHKISDTIVCLQADPEHRSDVSNIE